MNRFIRKSWYTLTDAADYLSQSIEEDAVVSVSDLLQLAMEGELDLSLRITRYSDEMVKRGSIRSRVDFEDIHILVNSAGNFFGMNSRTDQSALADMSPGYIYPDLWDISFIGNGNKLYSHLWAITVGQANLNPNKITVDEVLQRAIAWGDDEIRRDLIIINRLERDIAALPLKLIPENSCLVVRTANLDKLLASATTNIDTDHTSTLPATTDDDSEVARLQRTVAGLALGLMREYPKYRHGDKPNISKLTDLAIDHLRSEDRDQPLYGFGKSTINDTIKAALKRYHELSE
jgi:hypothetical protein